MLHKTLLVTAATALTIFGASARYTVVSDTLRDSKVYHGTVHTMRVTVPQDMAPGSRVGLYLGLDGVLCDAPHVLDSLSAAGVIPPMVGVYLQPGVVYGKDGKVLRYNRSNEFDAIDGRFAGFLDTEVLPAVDSIVSLYGEGLSVSPLAQDRMIFGLSSGGIAAFVAAWHRPDLFGKVFTGCGTFVPMRGGHNLQAIVRKHEPKPLRIFMQDGSKDAWNPLFGSWYEANRVLASALQFAGYDCDFMWDDSGHSVAPSTRIFPEVVRWMWRDGNAPIKPGTTKNNMLSRLLIAGEDWGAKPVTSAAAPQSGRNEAIYPDSTIVAYVVPGTNFLWQALIDENGQRYDDQRYYWLHDYDHSALVVHDMTFDPDGNLWVLSNAGLQILDQNGRVRAILNLPRELEKIVQSGASPLPVRLSITENCVTVTTPDNIYTRRVNLPNSAKPVSQGPA